jgi:hypothetical protein
MSATPPTPVARHVSQNVFHDKAQRTADTDMRQFALFNEAAQGAG